MNEWAKYLVDGEVVSGLAAAMARAESIFQSTGIIVAIEEVADDVQ